MKKILIANRSEIAIRIARSVSEQGHCPVMIFSDVDEKSPHLRFGQEAYRLNGNTPKETYLDIDKIIHIAKQAKVNAIHPGYGFLSENADFSLACEKAGIVFIGPTPKNIEDMGDKIQARTLAKKAGLPTLSGGNTVESFAEAKKQAELIGYPVLIKAKAGGGGKGMRRVDSESHMDEAFRLAKSEAEKSFKDGSLYVEKFLDHARHVEVQIMADKHGNVFAIGDRDCSIQRRHQKIIEEAPAPHLRPETRKKMAEAAINLAKSVGYHGAGTLEFLVDKNEQFYFLEMNTRLQVEHPVTEWTSGLDLVALQLDVAFEKKLNLPQNLHLRGHSIEVRVYAEDPDNNFFPVPGTLDLVAWPQGPFVRVDAGFETGSEVTLFYDPMLAKISAFAPTRRESISRIIGALKDTVICGTKTNIGFLMSILNHAEFIEGNLSTAFIPDHGPFVSASLKPDEIMATMAAVFKDTAMGVDQKKNTSASLSSAWWRSGLKSS